MKYMQIFNSLISVIFALLGLICWIWTMVGISTGILLVIKYFSSKEENKRIKLKKWILISFGGFLGLIIVLILWFILQIVLSFLGINAYTPL
jgi:hypothetical protein